MDFKAKKLIASKPSSVPHFPICLFEVSKYGLTHYRIYKFFFHCQCFSYNPVVLIHIVVKKISVPGSLDCGKVLESNFLFLPFKT